MNKFFTILMICMYYSVSAVHTSKAQFNPTYNNDGTYTMRGTNDSVAYQYNTYQGWFKMSLPWLILTKGTPNKYLKLDDSLRVTEVATIPASDITGLPTAPVSSVNGQTGAVTIPVFDSNYNQLKNKPTIPQQNVYNAGWGITKVGSEPNATFVINQDSVMTSKKAADSIQSLKSDINGKVPQSRTLRIVGATPSTAQTMNNDITWNVFDGNYNNLANKPTIPAQFNPIQGTGVTISGSYPNMTFSAASSIPTYSKSALLSNAGVLITDTFTVASATPTISFASILSTVGKSNFKIISATGYRAGATATTSPQVSVTAITSNSATFNITQQNTATVTILSINVLSGLPLILAPDPQNVKLIVSLIAY